MTEEETISKLRSEHVNCINNGDTKGVIDRITEDGVTMPPNQSPLVGKDALSSYLNEGFNMAATYMEVESLDLVVSGDIAYDRFSFIQEITPADGGEKQQESGNCVWLWRKEADGEWRIWHAIWNSSGGEPTLWTGGR